VKLVRELLTMYFFHMCNEITATCTSNTFVNPMNSVSLALCAIAKLFALSNSKRIYDRFVPLIFTAQFHFSICTVSLTVAKISNVECAFRVLISYVCSNHILMTTV
ncbi:hypothetical protein PRIPAC_74588, partial [Pristionchus pacificus]